MLFRIPKLQTLAHGGVSCELVKTQRLGYHMVAGANSLKAGGSEGGNKWLCTSGSAWTASRGSPGGTSGTLRARVDTGCSGMVVRV